MIQKPKAPLKPKASQPSSVSDSPTKCFNRKVFIPGFGMVLSGDKLTEEIHEAWKKKTKVSIDKFLGEPLPEKPKE